MSAPVDSDAEWYGRELNRQADRAIRAIDQRDRAMELLNELVLLWRVVELLELVRERHIARRLERCEICELDNRPGIVCVGDQADGRNCSRWVHRDSWWYSAATGLRVDVGEMARAADRAACTCVDHDHTGKVPPREGCPVHTHSGALAEVLELSRRRR